jgi:hypothetical protein
MPPERVELLLQTARPDAEHKPPAGDGVEAGRRLDDDERVALASAYARTSSQCAS